MPTQRTLDHLRRAGFIAEVVERWIPRANVRKEFIGCVDIICFHRSRPGIIGIQATSLANLSARLAKGRNEPRLAAWLRAGGEFQVWGWAKKGAKWEPKVVAVSPQDLAPTMLIAPGRRRKKPEQPELFSEGRGV